MTYNVFDGTLSLAESINPSDVCPSIHQLTSITRDAISVKLGTNVHHVKAFPRSWGRRSRSRSHGDGHWNIV